MPLYDQFNGSQINNGVGPPNPQASVGVPGLDPGAWNAGIPQGIAGARDPAEVRNLWRDWAGKLQGFLGGRGVPQGLFSNNALPQQPQGAVPGQQPQNVFRGPAPASLPPGTGTPGTVQTGSMTPRMSFGNLQGGNFAGGLKPFIGG